MTLQASDLQQFTGTENYYRSSIFSKNFTHTDGVNYLVKEGRCYWLLDEIVNHNITMAKVRKEGFQVWKLAKKNSSAVLTMEDGNGNVIRKKKIGYTDFPLDEITIYHIGGVTLLTSEY